MALHLQKLQSTHTNAYRDIRLECLKNYPENFRSNYGDEVKKEKLFFHTFIETLINY